MPRVCCKDFWKCYILSCNYWECVLFHRNLCLCFHFHFAKGNDVGLHQDSLWKLKFHAQLFYWQLHNGVIVVTIWIYEFKFSWLLHQTIICLFFVLALKKQVYGQQGLSCIGMKYHEIRDLQLYLFNSYILNEILCETSIVEAPTVSVSFLCLFLTQW